MNLLGFALLTILVSVGSCSVTWDDLRSFLDEDKLEKRDTEWVDGSSPITCPTGKAVSSIALSNGKLGISCDRNVASSQCRWTEKFSTVKDCYDQQAYSSGVIAGIQRMNNMWKLRCCLSSGFTTVWGNAGVYSENDRYDVPRGAFLCGAMIVPGASGRITQVILGRCES